MIYSIHNRSLKLSLRRLLLEVEQNLKRRKITRVIQVTFKLIINFAYDYDANDEHPPVSAISFVSLDMSKILRTKPLNWFVEKDGDVGDDDGGASKKCGTSLSCCRGHCCRHCYPHPQMAN